MDLCLDNAFGIYLKPDPVGKSIEIANHMDCDLYDQDALHRLVAVASCYFTTKIAIVETPVIDEMSFDALCCFTGKNSSAVNCAFYRGLIAGNDIQFSLAVKLYAKLSYSILHLSRLRKSTDFKKIESDLFG